MGAQNPILRCTLCLAALTRENKTNEDAIPRALGGRIVSDRITCAGCNNKTGSTIDKYLTECYFPVTGILSEFMPARNDVIGNRRDGAIFLHGGREFRIKMPLDPEQSANGVYIATDASSGCTLITGANAQAAVAKANEIGRLKYGKGNHHIQPVASSALPPRELPNIHLP